MNVQFNSHDYIALLMAVSNITQNKKQYENRHPYWNELVDIQKRIEYYILEQCD
jgi:formiminotetrahydrofolate cyclodeaminase